MKKQEEYDFRTLMVGAGAVKYKTLFTKKYANRKPYEPHDPNKIISFIPGTVLKLFVREGHSVKQGDRLLILEAMKMKNEILSPHDGVIKGIYVKEGERVAKNVLLIEFN